MKKHLSILAILILTTSAFAQTATAGASASVNNAALNSVLSPLISVGLTAALGLLSGLLVRGMGYVKSKTALIKNQTVQDAANAVFSLVFAKVAELGQDAVSNLKAASASGTLTSNEATGALTTAVNEVWATIPDALKTVLVGAYGSPDQVKTGLIVPQVKQAVQAQKESLIGSGVATATGQGAPSALELRTARARIGVS